MPPKKPKLHELAVEVASGTTFLDVSKKVQYVMGYQFATGGFGRIYTCKEQGKSNELVVKVEPNTNGPLFTEIHVFQRILKKDMLDNYAKQKKLSSVALPWIVASGTFDYKSEKLRYMIMPKYETSLEAVREHNGGSLSAFDTWNTASTMLNALEYLHHNKYVHADLKAANILLKKKTDMKTAVLVDFGLARMASSNVDKPEKKRAHNGTAIFTSIDAHRGCNPSYRGDIEILAYNALFWISGKLPWQSVEANPDKVFNEKQKFMDNLQDGIAKLVKSSASSTAIKDLFNVALKTKYTEQVDFSNLHNPVDRAISATRNESAVTKKTRTITPKKSTANRTKTVQKKAVAKEETDESKESTGEGSPEKVKPASALVTMRRRLARKRSSTEEEEYEIGSLKENVATEKKPKVGTTPASLQKTSDRLRQNVPGLRNLPKGRRSIVVNQIAKKYHKIAAKKAVDE